MHVKNTLIGVLLLALAPLASAQTTIEFWHIFSGSLGEVIEAMAEEFEVQHPGIDVEPVYVPYDAMQRTVLSAVAAGDPPPIAQLELTLMARMAAEGALKPLREVLPEDDFEAVSDLLLPSIASANSYDGVLYTVPMGYNSNVLYYNPELLAQAGIGEDELPRTWDQLIDVAQQLTVDENGDGRNEVTGYGFPARAPWVLEVRFWQTGTELFNEQGTLATFDSPEGLELLQSYRSMIESGGSVMVSADTALNQLADMFGAGQIAMFEQSSTAFFGIDERADFEVGMTRFPTMGANVFSMGGYNLGVFDGVSDAEAAAAAQLARWWASPEVAADWTSRSNYTPGIDAAWETDTLQAWLDEDPRRGVAAEQMSAARPRPNLPSYPEIAEIITDAFEATMANDADPAEELAAAQLEANEVLSR